MKKILCVEDNEDNTYMLKLLLEKHNFEAIFASDGEEALALSISAKPDLIIMDLGLPKMTGFDAICILKSHEETRAIPIIVLTAHTMMIDKERALKAGADDFETKPINVKQLVAKIEKWL